MYLVDDDRAYLCKIFVMPSDENVGPFGRRYKHIRQRRSGKVVTVVVFYTH